jgi:cyclomaltodextrin glucanotransferase
VNLRLPCVAVVVLLFGSYRALAQQSATNADPAGADYRSRTIYFLVTDRFHAHEPYSPYVDPQYPDATNTVNCFVQSCTEEIQFRKYWGGDINGVAQKLDYLDRLGVSAVWLTPLMENVRAYESGTGYGTGYHGYWVQNYFRVNQHFGSWNDVNQMSDRFHERGIRYVQDITLNHSNPNDNHVFGRLFESQTTDQVFINSFDDDYDSATGTRYYKHYASDQRCVDAATIPDYEWTYWQLHHCPLADLSGYNQRNPAMAEYLLQAGKTWIDNGVDDFRLDAVKFPFPEFIANFTHTMRSHLADLGRPEPYIVGEWSHGGVGDTKSLRFANSFNFFGTNILDFSLSLALNEFMGGSWEPADQRLSASGLDVLLHQRVQAFRGRDTWQGTFIDNHDQIRSFVRLQKLGVSDELERQQRMDLATVLLMTVRGIPIIYYGDEQYLAYYNDNQDTPPEYVNTGNDDPWNRPGMTSWDEDTGAFKTISVLANLRKHSAAVAKGSYRTIYAQGDVLVFERIFGSDRVLVAVNRGDETTIHIHAKAGLHAGCYSGLLSHAADANDGNFVSVSAQELTIHMNKLSSLVVHP